MSASLGVIPTPSAAFSPLATHEVEVQLLTQPGQPLLDRAEARAAVHVRDEEDLQGVTCVAASCTSTDTWFPASCVYRASACCSTSEKSMTVSDLRDGRGDGRADRQRRIRAEVRHANDERRLVRRLDVDSRPEHLAAKRQRRDSDDRPVHRRVDVGARRGAHVERGRARSGLHRRAWSTRARCSPPPKSLPAIRWSSPSFFWRPTGSRESAPPPTAW